MSMVTVSTTRRRIYTRKFDHDECQALFATGDWSKQALADRYGVDPTAVARVVRPETRERMQRARDERSQALCDDCGGPCTKNWWASTVRTDRVVCLACSHERRREDELLKRLDTTGDIHCRVCKQHKPIEEYRLRPSTGYPFDVCRPCETAARRAYRHAHRDAENTRNREYKRRKRAHPLCEHGYYAARCPRCSASTDQPSTSSAEPQ